MAKPKIYGLKNCDTCRKAMKALDAASVPYVFHDVRADGVSIAQIKSWAKAAGWEALLNTRSTTWRSLSAKDKTGVDKKRRWL